MRMGRIDAEMEALDQEITVLESFGISESPTEFPAAEIPSSNDAGLLSGGAIRLFAVPLLLRERGTAPIHYREWEALVRREGFRIAGKRPEAVFLNQVSRSPLVRATTKPGYYQLYLEAPERLRVLLGQQQQALMDLMRQVPETPADLEEHRRNQQELNRAIAKTQRELDEANEALEAGQRSEYPQAA